MSRFPMNPYDEQRLIQEVRYLHSLWHQGPPHPHPHPHPHPQTHPNHPTTPWSLQPSSSTKFKNRSRKKDSKWLKETDFQDSGIEWTCKSPTKSPPLTESGWPSFKPQPNKKSHLPTVEELAIVEANRVQQHALKAVSEYLKYSIDDEDDDDEYDEDDEDVMEIEKGEKSLSFFAKLFEEDSGLREYYVKNSESGSGEFSCLVCCGVGKKGWNKRFKDCVALVQHSISIAKTNSRQAHRAYGQVICRVLGWDINRLGDKQPAEAQVLGSGTQTSSLANSNDGSNKTLQGDEHDGGKDGSSGPSNTTDTPNISNAELSSQKQSFSNENQQENGGGSTALERNSPVEASVSDGIPETAKENTEGVSNCLGNEGNDGTVGSNELSQQKEPFGNEKKQQNAGGSMGLEGNEGNAGKNNLSGQSSTTDTGTVGSNELSQQNAGGSTGLEPGTIAK